MSSRELHFEFDDGRVIAANVYDGDDVEAVAKDFQGVVRVTTPEGEQVWPAIVEVPAPRLCIDCTFHERREAKGAQGTRVAHLCTFRGKQDEMCLVTGEKRWRPAAEYCEPLRDDESLCGSQAAWFQPKAAENAA